MEYVAKVCSFLVGVGIFLLTSWNMHNHMYGIQPNIGVFGFIGIPLAALALTAAFHHKR